MLHFALRTGNCFLHATFFLPQKGDISLRLYSAKGEKVSTLFEGVAEKGIFSRSCSTTGLPAGIYFCRLVTPQFNRASCVTIVK
jgi:hypothetical protein